MADKKTVLPLIGGVGLGALLGWFVKPSNGARVTINPNPVSANANFTSTMTGFPPNTVLYGIATVNTTPWTVFEAGMTDANGNLVASAVAPSTTGNFPMIVFSTINGGSIAVTVLTIK